MAKNPAPYTIIVAREWLDRPDTRQLEVGAYQEYGVAFATREAAASHIDDLIARPYHCARNEAGRPTYAIRKVAQLSAYLAVQLS